ncbi:hypothetical protein XELAEV_18030714mg [Xenopus laevis]|uniref:Uncharacterized protein n=1 Tax=Xenopus laevis TaxID=8355 RepID=A0A974CLB8_XENLA|nr:hypothetical protein XELAEV_18030714mg [Xenopus laevis]
MCFVLGTFTFTAMPGRKVLFQSKMRFGINLKNTVCQKEIRHFKDSVLTRLQQKKKKSLNYISSCHRVMNLGKAAFAKLTKSFNHLQYKKEMF